MENSEGVEVASGYSHVRSKSTSKVNSGKKHRPYYAVKRIADVVLGSIALVVLSPLFLIVAIAIKWDSPGPVFYSHERVGKNGKMFKLYKFRTMMNDNRSLEAIFSPEQMKQWKRDYKVDHDPRITKIGHLLRKTSLDELPQFLNVLKGEISLVGPRPIIQEETERYGKQRDELLQIKPGLTGYWQVNGRSNTTYEMRMQMELYYVKNQSIWFDIQILFRTFIVIITQNGAK